MLSSRQESTPDEAPARTRWPLAVYLVGITAILTAFLLEIARGHCPVP